ncbi:hypothetical protein BJ508DRAFT_412625 [Ascobolus immersus RN42]|uniref:Rhodopsin domain-containing protein n=1 Tax=Ascobolus immersus RN42 TaxID=1160509 RepID=A0A3N4ISG5_ASCIM|nr:hypothetical protein BJ508DRAFT_412625 [Ascobolus immersus RN42]
MSIQCGLSFHRVRQWMSYDKINSALGFSKVETAFLMYDPNLQSPYGPNWKTWFQFLLHILTVWLLKGCYLGFFFRLAEILPKKLKIYLYATGSFCVASTVISLLLIVFWCYPIANNWNLAPDAPIDSSKMICSTFAAKPVLVTFTSLCVVADAMILILSVLLITHLKLKVQSHYVSIFIAVLLGILSIVAAVARLYLFLKIIPYSTFSHVGMLNKYFESAQQNGTPLDFQSFFSGIALCQWLQILFRIEVMQGVFAYGFTFGRHRVRVVIVSLLGVPTHFWRVCWGRIRYGNTDAADVYVLAGKKRRRRRSSVEEISVCGRRRESEPYIPNPGMNTPTPGYFRGSSATTLRTAWYECPNRLSICPWEKAFVKDEESEGVPCTPLGGLSIVSTEGPGESRGGDSKRGLLGMDLEEVEEKESSRTNSRDVG